MPISNGNTRFSQPLIPNPVAGDFVSVDANGVIQDSGISLSTDSSFITPSNTQVPSTAAVFNYISSIISNSTNFRGGYDASTNLFPTTGGSGTAGAIRAGDTWAITVAGTLGGTSVTPGNTILALVNTPGQTASNWLIGVGGVSSVNGMTGPVSLGISALTDTNISSPTNNQLLIYNSGSSKWVNTSALPTLTLTNATNQIVTSGAGRLSISTALDTVSVVPSTAGGSTFLTGLGTNGILTYAQPAFSDISGTLGFSQGGTGQTSQQNAMNALAGAVTSGSYLRGDGTNVLMSTIQAADIPTLNQNTTGTAANVSGVIAITNGGSGQTTATAAFNALAPSQSSNASKLLLTDGTNTSWSLLTNSQFQDNTVAYSRLVNIGSSQMLGRFGSSGTITAMSVGTIRNLLSIPTSVTSGNFAAWSGTAGAFTDSGVSSLSAASVPTYSSVLQYAIPYFTTTGSSTLTYSSILITSVIFTSGSHSDGNFPLFQTINGNPNGIVDSNLNPGYFGHKYMFLRLNTTQTTVTNGSVIKFDTVDLNTTTASYNSSTGQITLTNGKFYKMRAYVHPRWTTGVGSDALVYFTLNGNVTQIGGGVITRPVTSLTNEAAPKCFEAFYEANSANNTVQVTMIQGDNMQDFYGGNVTYMILEEYPQ